MKDEETEAPEVTYLNATQILAADDLKLEEVRVPEWGGTVMVRPLSAGEAMEFFENQKNDRTKAMARIIVQSVVNADGSPLFTDKDVAKLQKKSLKALSNLQDSIIEINGMGKASKAKNG